MNTAASSGTATPVGFAIPIGSALSIAERIAAGQEGGTVSIGYPAFLGVELAPSFTRGGAVIAGTVDGAPADAAGLAAGDTITALGRTPISSAQDLSAAVASHEPGSPSGWPGWTPRVRATRPP